MTNYSASGRDYLKPHLLIHCCLVALVFASAQMCQDPIIIRPSSADLIHCCIVAKVLASAPAVPRPCNHTAISWPNTLLHIVAKVFTSAQLCRDPLINNTAISWPYTLLHCRESFYECPAGPRPYNHRAISWPNTVWRDSPPLHQFLELLVIWTLTAFPFYIPNMGNNVWEICSGMMKCDEMGWNVRNVKNVYGLKKKMLGM